MVSRSRPLVLLGVAAFVVGLVGFVVFGWRFGGSSDPLATALGVAVALVAVAVTVRRLV